MKKIVMTILVAVALSVSALPAIADDEKEQIEDRKKEAKERAESADAKERAEQGDASERAEQSKDQAKERQDKRQEAMD